MTIKPILLITFITFLLGGCVSNPRHNYTPEIVGGIAGGVIGSQIGKGSGRLIMTSIGTLTGVIVGQELSKTNQGTQQNETIVLCKDYPTEGEVVACERGVEARNQRIQRQREQNAYNRGNRGWFF